MVVIKHSSKYEGVDAFTVEEGETAKQKDASTSSNFEGKDD